MNDNDVSTREVGATPPYPPPPPSNASMPPPPPSPQMHHAASATGALGDSGVHVTVPGTNALVVLPDTPESAAKRQTYGWVMLAASGVTLLALLLPWVSGPGEEAVSLAGYEVSSGAMAGFAAVVLGVYGWQALGKPRVRFHVAALVLLITAFIGTMATVPGMSEDELAKPTGDSPSTLSANVLGFEVGIETDSSFGTPDTDDVALEFGVYVAVLAQLGAAVPLIVLWRDDRDRRRQAGVLL